MAPKVDLIGDRNEAEKLRGFALSQLRILHDTMKFQGLKQYSRVVHFANKSYVHAFSCFGMDLVTIYVPPGAIPSEEIVKIEEGTFVFVEHIEIDIEVFEPDVACTWQWVYKSHTCGLPGTGVLLDHSCDDCSRSWSYELIVGNKRQLQSTLQSCWNDGFGKVGYDNCIDPDHNPYEEVAWDFYTDYSECAVPGDCDVCDSPQKVWSPQLLYYEWECV